MCCGGMVSAVPVRTQHSLATVPVRSRCGIGAVSGLGILDGSEALLSRFVKLIPCRTVPPTTIDPDISRVDKILGGDWRRWGAGGRRIVGHLYPAKSITFISNHSTSKPVEYKS